LVRKLYSSMMVIISAMAEAKNRQKDNEETTDALQLRQWAKFQLLPPYDRRFSKPLHCANLSSELLQFFVLVLGQPYPSCQWQHHTALASLANATLPRVLPVPAAPQLLGHASYSSATPAPYRPLPHALLLMATSETRTGSKQT
jgi:hypothetical protein